MQLINDMGKRNIREVIEEHPRIGEILESYEIGCTKCTIGTCQLKEVVKVHFLGKEIEDRIEMEINEYLATL